MLSEVSKIDKRRGLDLRNAEVMLPTLKMHLKKENPLLLCIKVLFIETKQILKEKRGSDIKNIV